MTPIDVTLDLSNGPWSAELAAARDAGQLASGTVTHIGLLPGGTSSGRASVAMLVKTTDGQVVVCETTLNLFAGAARALLASPIATAEGHAWS
jgi:hypothetical protein